jgi:hypothetical protein
MVSKSITVSPSGGKQVSESFAGSSDAVAKAMKGFASVFTESLGGMNADDVTVEIDTYLRQRGHEREA